MNESDPYTISFPVKASVSTRDLKDKHGFRTELSQMHDDRGMTDAKPSAPSITAQNISYLDDEINRLAAGIEALSFELKPVLTEDSPEKASESPGYSGNTELNEAIASQCRRLNTLNEILRALTARIDL